VEPFKHVKVPGGGDPIQIEDGRMKVPDHLIIPSIEGDGIGLDITPATQRVMDAAVEHCYSQRKLFWTEIFVGQKALPLYGELLPEETLRAIRHFGVALKGPLTTPIGKGYRSLNVALRKALDLYACVRPIKYIRGTPSPIKDPERVDVVIFRENTEDVYAGIEFEAGSPEAAKLRVFLADNFNAVISEDSGIGVKPMSRRGTERLVRKALQYAVRKKRRSVTLIHKGNIMKYTEGAFVLWGYDLARREFGESIVTAEDAGASGSRGAILFNDRIADNMLQQILINPDQYDVLALPNLNGDYMSDLCAAMIGGLGLAPGSNIGDHLGVFEATHGTAPDIAGKNIANPSALVLSGALLLEHIGWEQAADLVRATLEKTILKRQVTGDIAAQMGDSSALTTSEFAQAMIDNMK